MKTKRPEKPQRVVNLLTIDMINAITDGVQKSAFQVSLSGLAIILSVADAEVFRVDLSGVTISWTRDGSTDKVWTCPPDHWWRSNPEQAAFERLEQAAKEQFALGGMEALTTNLLSRREITVLVDAIRAMAFKIEKIRPGLATMSFEGRQVFQINTEDKTIHLSGLSGVMEQVYQFTDEPEAWFWSGTDRRLWQEVVKALAFYEATIHRVRMSDYRAVFGNQMQKVIMGLAAAMDEAEADVRMLERVDKTGGGAALHPDVARMVQKDLEAGEESETKE